MEVKVKRASIAEEEELRLGLEALGHVHDCVEAGCELNPANEKLSEGGKAQRRPKPSKRLKLLWRKYREGTL